MRRIAAHEVIIDGETHTFHVVEFEGGRVLCHYPLTGEQPGTEWVCGTITIDNGQLIIN